MDAELTNKSRDAINAATSRAVKDGHADLTPGHLLLALLEGRDNENIVDLLAAVEADQAVVRSETERLLGGCPASPVPPSPRRLPTASCWPSSRTPPSGPRSWATTTSPPSTC